MSFPPVSVGQTDYPLRSDATFRGPLSHFDATKPASGAFRLLDGPPYANGSPHLGHVLNKHLKDAVARAARAEGHKVEWRPGWDCHGLPLELAVEKQGVPRADRQAFVDAARRYATEQASVQASVFMEQGWSAQWEAPWHTQDPAMEAGTLRVLADLLDRDQLEVRFAAVPWCTRCGSTLSGAEQEEKPWVTQAWLVPFDVSDGEVLLSWTTTPWTLPLHRALVVNAHATYAALDLAGARAWVSEETAEHWASVLGATLLPDRQVGAQLAGRAYRTPWSTGQVALDERVLPGAGTGVLHAVPGLSELDTVLGRDHGWDLVQHLSPDGRVLGSSCETQNGHRAGTAEAAADALAAYSQSPWFRQLPYTAQHPHCWRHHTPLLTRASRQLFLRLDEPVRARAEALVSQLEFTPEAGRTRLLAAMRNRPDWCLSRQRTWGVPVALFLDRSTGKPHAKASTWMRRAADGLAVSGVEAWWSRPSEDWVLEDADLADLERMEDVLDVWFDSGCVPQLVGTGDVVVEGTDQHRGWFQSCLWVAAALDAGLPFKRVATHGFVLGADGQKLSKSTGGDKKGGGSGPKAPSWQQLPTDVVRLWAMSGTEGHDKVWSQATVTGAQSACARLRGVLRFMLSNTLPRQMHQDASAAPAWDRYWWKRSQEVSDQVLALCSQARVGEALSLVVPFAENFSSAALGSWKDRLYCAPHETFERQQLDVVLRGCLSAWGRMLEVLTPRLRAEAQPFWPVLEEGAAAPCVSEAEVAEVERVLALREAMGPTTEALGRAKVAPGARRVAVFAGAPAWPGQLLADALDVGQVSGEGESLEPVLLHAALGAFTVFVGKSSDPVCPRCRRAQNLWSGSTCSPCAARAPEGVSA